MGGAGDKEEDAGAGEVVFKYEGTYGG